MLYNFRVALSIALSISYVHMAYGADDQNNQKGVYRISKSYRPANPPIIMIQPSQPIKRDYSIAEYLLKDEIRSYGITAIRKRMQEAIAEADRKRGQTHICFQPQYLTINRTFYALSDDLLSRVVFNTIAEKPTTNLDDCTNYRKIDDTMQAVELIASITDNNFIETVIADIQKNG